MAEQTAKLDTLIFKLEKLFFISDCMSDRVGSPESFSFLLMKINKLLNLWKSTIIKLYENIVPFAI